MYFFALISVRKSYVRRSAIRGEEKWLGEYFKICPRDRSKQRVESVWNRNLGLYDKFTSRFQRGMAALLGIYPVGNQLVSFGEIRSITGKFEGGRIIESRSAKVDTLDRG